MLFKLARVRDKKTGEVRDLEKTYSGELCLIANVVLGRRLVAEFLDINKRLVTTEIDVYNSDWKSRNSLTVQTQNTVYVFEKGLR